MEKERFAFIVVILILLIIFGSVILYVANNHVSTSSLNWTGSLLIVIPTIVWAGLGYMQYRSYKQD